MSIPLSVAPSYTRKKPVFRESIRSNELYLLVILSPNTNMLDVDFMGATMNLSMEHNFCGTKDSNGVNIFPEDYM